MIITYRVNQANWTHADHGWGEIRRVTDKTKKPPRPAHFPSECDWMVPNLRDPYGQAETL